MNDQGARRSGTAEQRTSSGDQKSAARISQGDMHKVEQAQGERIRSGIIDGKADAKTQQTLMIMRAKTSSM
jgi:hypothetical protein